MRIAALMLCLLTVAAWADPPPPTGLALIQARYSGTWTVQDTSYDTGTSRAGTRQYELTRLCTLDGAVLDCKFYAQGILQGGQRFTWDAAAADFHVDMDIAGRPQPPITLTVRGNTWIFVEQTADRNGQPLKLRILRQYHSDSEVTSSAGYSSDGSHWTVMSRGTEVRKDTPKQT